MLSSDKFSDDTPIEYGVGQGYWANTAEVPNEVEVVVDVYAMQQ